MTTDEGIRKAQQAVRDFCQEREWDPYHGPKDLAIGLVTEASELLELFRFVGDGEADEKLNDPQFRARVQDELADVLFFLLRFSEKNRFDLLTALELKMRKNAEKYPVEKFRGSNKKYTEI